MSRVGKQPVTIPSGVNVQVQGQAVKVQGPKGTLEYVCPVGIGTVVEGGKVQLSCGKLQDKSLKAKYGTARAHINNMVIGVSKGWSKALELQGVGFSARLDQGTLVLAVGFSHDVKMSVPAGVTCKVEKTSIKLEYIDKQTGGDFAARIRKVQPPEPYLGKGIRYEGEQVRRKAGKTGKK